MSYHVVHVNSKPKRRKDRIITGPDAMIGAKIKARRYGLGLTQTHLASAIGVTPQQVQKYEAGINRVASSTLIKICKFLDIKVEDLFGPLFNQSESTKVAEQDRDEYQTDVVQSLPTNTPSMSRNATKPHGASNVDSSHGHRLRENYYQRPEDNDESHDEIYNVGLNNQQNNRYSNSSETHGPRAPREPNVHDNWGHPIYTQGSPHFPAHNSPLEPNAASDFYINSSHANNKKKTKPGTVSNTTSHQDTYQESPINEEQGPAQHQRSNTESGQSIDSILENISDPRDKELLERLVRVVAKKISQ